MTAEEMRATEDAVALERFEALVLGQQPAIKAWTPVTDYSFEARAAIEGRHPDLIVEVFRPQRVVDMGCGPGHLVALLRARGVTVAGLDLPGWDLTGTVDWRWYALGPGSGLVAYDLVICREVLEHLTIRQIRTAVTNLCTLSSRFVYVTTRFAQHPMHLLDVDTADALDPTHITMLHQIFLRVLFVLEGFKRRADLEEQLDWMNKQRVLVYERV